jgi:YVTN family beta-propeller protein
MEHRSRLRVAAVREIIALQNRRNNVCDLKHFGRPVTGAPAAAHGGMRRGGNAADISQKHDGPTKAGAGSAAVAEIIPMTLKTVLTVMSGIFAVCVTIVVVIASALIIPGKPADGTSVHFEGYVTLPGHSMLSVLDYLTVSGRNLFVTSESTGAVYRVALHDGALPTAADVSEFTAEPAAHGVAIDPTSELAYVTRSEVDAVDVFNPRSMQLFKRIPVAADPDALAYDSRNKLFYAAGGDSNVATLIDPQTLASVARIPLGGRPEFVAFDPGSGLLYQNLEDDDSVVVLDLSKRAVVGRWGLWPCQAPTGMALEERRQRLFIGCKDNALLAVVDIAARRVLTTVPIGKGVDSVAFDPQLQRIYTTGKAGILVVIQQDPAGSYRVLDKLSLHYGAHTLAVDPLTHSLYVGYASLLVQPRIAVFSAKPTDAP